MQERVGRQDETQERVGRQDETQERVGRQDETQERVGRQDETQERVGRQDETQERVGRQDETQVEDLVVHASREGLGWTSQLKVSFPTKLLIVAIYCSPGSLDHFIDELDILLSHFPIEGNPLIFLGDFNLASDKLHSSCIPPLLTAFDLTLNHSPPTHKAGNVLDLIFTHEILQLLTSSNSTTCPLDPIPSTLFQTIARDQHPFISVIINNSLSSGYVPTAFKTAGVVPILKKATLDSYSVTNYRPVYFEFIH
ncbi:hypothetical protein P4O66_002963 [Electrophorus voltai]|uniref:Endonuclease/exonuclease/phosphatase domain-containing protein n=1 Tax=Electrophorus voltai TaxID=2609070 RepID=A0AAD8YUA8_9TELE|nr:hypothetical protein P4O66_002963 [Electrophorus voltai]